MIITAKKIKGTNGTWYGNALHFSPKKNLSFAFLDTCDKLKLEYLAAGVEECPWGYVYNNLVEGPFVPFESLSKAVIFVRDMFELS